MVVTTPSSLESSGSAETGDPLPHPILTRSHRHRYRRQRYRLLVYLQGCRQHNSVSPRATVPTHRTLSGVNGHLPKPCQTLLQGLASLYVILRQLSRYPLAASPTTATRANSSDARCNVRPSFYKIYSLCEPVHIKTKLWRVRLVSKGG